jgi:hypothetical protein
VRALQKSAESGTPQVGECANFRAKQEQNGFEHFDESGRYRETEGDPTIDTTGYVKRLRTARKP